MSRATVETTQRSRSGVKIAVRVPGSQEEKPQSGLAHAVLFTYDNVQQRDYHIDTIVIDGIAAI